MEQNIHNVNILLTCAYNRNNDETSTFMDGGPSNCGWGPDLSACLVGLRSHSQLHRGRINLPNLMGARRSCGQYLVYNTVVRLCQFFGCGGK